MSGIRIVFDGTTPRYFDLDNDGVEVDAATAGPRLSERQTNRVTLLDQARTAYLANKDYIALATPTNAQVAAQVKALTRQVNALIRLMANDLTGQG